MAEEIISIQVIDKDGDVRPFFVVSRTEAIERMAKAMSADDIPVGGYKVLAEAAMDALITEVK